MKGIFGTENLNVTYDKGTPKEFRALKNISFQAEPGEFVIVFGPSGCGKSTLLYALSGIERHTDGGSAWVNGKDIVNMTEDQLLDIHRHDVGMIFQAYNLISTLNIIGNVTLPLLARGMTPKDRTNRAMALLERFGVAHLAKRFPADLSGGQQQRVAIARALVTDPSIIFADEPTGNLDAASTEIVLKQLLLLRSQDKKAILMVTHDPTFLHYADRVVWLKDGNLVKVDEQKGTRDFTAIPTAEQPMVTEAALSGNAPKIEPVLEKKLYLGSSPFDQKFSEELPLKESARVAAVPKYGIYAKPETEPVLINRFERILFDIALGKLSEKDAMAILQKAISDGGLGCDQTQTDSILIEFGELFELRDWLIQYPPNERTDALAILHIMRFLLDGMFGSLSTTQDARLQNIVRDYLGGKINRQAFSAIYQAPVEHGGIGFIGMDSTHFLQKAELIQDLILM